MNQLRSHIQEAKENFVAKGVKFAQKPPRIVRKGPTGKDWDDGFAAVNHEIPKYQVAEDPHAQGYISGLQKQRRLKHYLNMVYTNASRERLQNAVSQ